MRRGRVARALLDGVGFGSLLMLFAGVAAVWWAAERPYRDNQRNVAVVLGLVGVALGLIGATVVIVSSLRQRRSGD